MFLFTYNFLLVTSIIFDYPKICGGVNFQWIDEVHFQSENFLFRLSDIILYKIQINCSFLWCFSWCSFNLLLKISHLNPEILYYRKCFVNGFNDASCSFSLYASVFMYDDVSGALKFNSNFSLRTIQLELKSRVSFANLTIHF